MPFDPSDAVFTIGVSAVILFRSFFANPRFHFCSALIGFILINLVLLYFCRVYLQDFTQHHSTIAATTNKRVSTEFDIVLLNYIILFYNTVLSPTALCFDCTNIHFNLIFLGYFIHRLNSSSQTRDFSRNTVLAI